MPPKTKIIHLTDYEHVLQRPDTYVGSKRTSSSAEYIGDIDTNTIRKETIHFSPAILRIFIEVLSNAIDNVQRSKEAGITCSKIKVSIDKETGLTSIWNDGLVVPVCIDEDEKVSYKHTLIFGNLRTSTNFNDEEERIVSGRNGMGVKLTNVFSTMFSVRGVDPEHGKMFFQEWKDNMTTVGKPKITSSSLKNGYTEVSWIPDFKYFGIDGYTDDIIHLYTRYVMDCAMLTKLNVYINDVKLPVKTLQEYSKLFTKPTDESVYFRYKDSEIMITSADSYEAISFVNGVFTVDGGVHVDAWAEEIFRPIVDKFNKPKQPQVNINDVKQFYRIFVVCTLVNPEFRDQSKTLLTSPNVSTSIDKKVITNILKWKNTQRISEIIKDKEFLAIKKTEVKKRGRVIIEGYDEANEAGGKNSMNCTLALCEGLSAKTFAIKGIDCPLFGRTGRDWFGVMALKGKILNPRKAHASQIAKNKEIVAIIQALGLTFGTDYTDDQNFSKLNYGKLLILTDADTDGKHIAGLIINMIHHLFPSLLKREQPFLVNMMTPIARFILKSKEEKVFYDLNRANVFYKNNTDKISVVKYYKGLGSTSSQEIPEVFGKRVISFVPDENSDVTIAKAFNQDTDTRKEWLTAYDPNIHTEINEETLEMNISIFIDEDLITYSIDHCKRSIPNLIDGLKESQRKILYSAFLKNLKKNFKVGQFAGYVAEKTNYHHGEDNLHNTITKMAQEFVGSNNIPLFYRDGQFGSREQNGKDASAARYIFTRLETITRCIYMEEDDELLEQVNDDGDLVEPVFYVPIIPMILVNGCESIATGWSSSIPCYNPLDVITCVRAWISGSGVSTQDGIQISSIPDIVPWYRGFTGTIEENGKNYICKGVCERKDDDVNHVVVTELPVGMTINSFLIKLQEMHKDKVIKGLKNNSGANKPYFMIDEFNDGLRCTVDNLKLSSNLNTTNMVLFNAENKVKVYNNVDVIIEEFCVVRLKYYHLRKVNLIKNLEYKLKIAKNKKRFISEEMSNIISIKGKKDADIDVMLKQAKYFSDTKTIDLGEDEEKGGFSYLLRMPIRTFSAEQIEKLEENIHKLQHEIDAVKLVDEKTMWLNDLNNLEKEYKIWLDDITASEAKTRKVADKGKTKKARKSKV